MAMSRILLPLLLMAAAFSSATALLQCSKQLETIEVVAGSWVLMPCSFNWTGALPEVRHAVWQKVLDGTANLVVHTTDRQAQKTQDYQFAGRTFIVANWFERREASLNVTNVSLNDTGMYQCNVMTQRPHAVDICASITLTVTDAATAMIGSAVLLLIGLALPPVFS